MKRLGAVLIVISATVYSHVAKAQTGTALPALQQLKAENFKLKLELAKTKALLADREWRLSQVALSAEQTTLVQEFRRSLNFDESCTWDWESLQPKCPSGEKKNH